ncbi:MAG: peptidoglycan DD-metalloendopeptidase family protein [Clostridia bacterium]|nr:peptidoglycan DD-metalloendopeptidase family protein [Clostridia bacterium]
MKKISVRMIAAALSIAILAAVFCSFSASAATESELRKKISDLESQSQQLEKKIKDLKSQNADQQAVVNAFQQKINNTQRQIDLCNSEIGKINATIAANKAEIQQNQKQIEQDKLTFKKRIRAISMTNSDSTVKILLGAKKFSDYLQLSQMTSAVSSHDRALMEKIVAAIQVLEEKNRQNEALLNEQVEIRKTIAAKQQELKAQQAQAQAMVNSISAQTKDVQQDNAAIEAQIKQAKRDLENKIRQSAPPSSFAYSGGEFIWPVPGFYNITQQFKGSAHTGVDISSGASIAGARVVAVANGVVDAQYFNSGWSASDGKSGLNSYGNYVVVHHGVKNGASISTWYAHLQSVSVRPGQTVQQGQTIGTVGRTGNVFGATGYHLHFSVKSGSSFQNPMAYYSKTVR